MEVREHDLALAHARPLGLDRLLHLDHHLGLGPHVSGPGHERPARHAIRLVRKPRADPRPLLHEHAVPVAYQRLDPRRHQRHTVLGGFDLFGDANDHADRKSTRLNSSHGYISYAVFCLKKKKQKHDNTHATTTSHKTTSRQLTAHNL